MFIEILFKMLLFKGGVLIYAEHCIYSKWTYFPESQQFTKNSFFIGLMKYSNLLRFVDNLSRITEINELFHDILIY